MDYKTIRVVPEDSPEAKLYTHTPPHHADEVFATAILSFIEEPVVVRTRNINILEKSQGIVYDVGGKYDAENGFFDHHQIDFKRERSDRIKYSSAGLIWEYYGREVLKVLGCDEKFLQEAQDMVDYELIKGIDANDNGQSKEVGEMSVSAMISLYNPNWDENKLSKDEAFIKACNAAREILVLEIKKVLSKLKGGAIVRDAITKRQGPILMMSRFIGGWIEEVLSSTLPSAQKILYGIYVGHDKNWCIRAVPPSAGNLMEQRKPFPCSWRGLSGEALEKACGIKNVVFCHKAGFFAVAATKEAAVEMAEKSAEFPDKF